MGLKVARKKLNISVDGPTEYLGGAVTASPIVDAEMYVVGRSVTFNKSGLKLSAVSDGIESGNFKLEPVGDASLDPAKGKKFLKALGFDTKDASYHEDGSITFKAGMIKMSNVLNELQSQDRLQKTAKERIGALSEWLAGERDSLDVTPTPEQKSAAPSAPARAAPTQPSPAPSTPQKAVPTPKTLSMNDVDSAEIGEFFTPGGTRPAGSRALG